MQEGVWGAVWGRGAVGSGVILGLGVQLRREGTFGGRGCSWGLGVQVEVEGTCGGNGVQ